MLESIERLERLERRLNKLLVPDQAPTRQSTRLWLPRKPSQSEWESATALDYPIGWRTEGKRARPYLGNEQLEWAPFPGAQLRFLASPVQETLITGNRGGGKTDALLMDFVSQVGRGFGAAYRGVLFRESYPQLKDVIAKSQIFKPLFGATYNKQAHEWEFPGGEVLLFRHMRTPQQYWDHHGSSYSWIGWEELSNWANDSCYRVMFSLLRSKEPDISLSVRATTNPFGLGTNWIKARFALPHGFGKVIYDGDQARVAINSDFHENIVLRTADPNYLARVVGAARNPSERDAWEKGSWDITSGGMFDDLWRGQTHVVPTVPSRCIPASWRIDRSFDWGSSKPFSVGWWAESNGEPFEFQGRKYGTIKGDTYRIAEWYGWNGTRDTGLEMLAADIAQGIRDREEDLGIWGRVKPGPADASIYDTENGNNIAADMAAKGVRWEPADKGPGSRKQGWQALRKLLAGSLAKPGLPRENPGLFVFDCCKQAIELIPSTPRDPKDLDDVDTKSEDHLADEVRYRVRRKVRAATSSNR